MVNWTYQFFLNAQIITDFSRIALRVLFTFLYYMTVVHMPEIIYFAIELISEVHLFSLFLVAIRNLKQELRTTSPE